jgi:hypothetical protein
MKALYLFPFLFLSACSTAPRLALTPQSPPPATDDAAVRYPEVIRAYHVGRYSDPNDDLVMHEQHVVYRVEANTRWDFRPGNTCGNPFAIVPAPHDVAFNPPPFNEAILAEVNSQRLATGQIMREARTLSSALAKFQTALQQSRTNLQETAALRVTVNDMQKRLDALDGTIPPPPSQSVSAPNLSTTNKPPDLLAP